MIEAVIIEDEAYAVKNLEAVLKLVAPDIRIVEVIDNVQEATQWLCNHQPQLIFADIHLGDDLVFKIFDQVSVSGHVIFTTAYNQYAIRAFKLNSIDYLLKPVTEADMTHALIKYRKLTESAPVDFAAVLKQIQQPQSWQNRFMVVAGQRIRSIEADTIAYFYSEGRYTKLVTLDDQRFILDQTLESLEQRTDPMRFFRVNRQMLVGFPAIRQMIIWSKSRVKLELTPDPGFEVIASIDRSGEFKHWLNR